MIIHRGDFWIGVLIFLLLLSIVFWGNITIDLTLHDTYFVIPYQHFIAPTIIWFSCVFGFYSWSYKIQRPLRLWIVVVHVSISWVTTLMYINQLWGHQIALTGFSKRYFLQTTESLPNFSVLGFIFLIFSVNQLLLLLSALQKYFLQRH